MAEGRVQRKLAVIPAADPEFRGQGLGAQLLSIADRIAADAGKSGLGIIVSDANTGARRLYERWGYRQLAKRRKVKEDWEADGDN